MIAPPALRDPHERMPPEGEIAVETIGAVPADLRGEWLSNGPAVFRAGDLRYRHWLDGDGWVLRVRFGDRGEVTAAARLVGTRKRQVEAEEGRAVFRTFATAFPGDRLALGQGIESPANIAVERWAGRLLAFGEQGLPYELDPETLETIGPFTFDRRLNTASPLAAHTRVDPATDEHVAFGVSFNPVRPTVTIYGSRPDLETRRFRVPLPYAASTHDFAITERFAVVYLAPYVLDVEAVKRDGASVLDALSWRPELGARLLVVDRATGEVAVDRPVDGGYCLHLANAFERGGEVVVDLLELDRPVYPSYLLDAGLYRDAPLGRPVRWTVDLASGRIGRRAYDEAETSLDFPVIPAEAVGRPYGLVWYLGQSRAHDPGPKLFDRIHRLDWESGELRSWPAPEGGVFAGELAATDGARHLIIPVATDRGSELWVIDPDFRDPAPRLRVVSSAPWPHRFHGTWAPAG